MNCSVMLTASAIIWEQGAENSLLCESPLNATVPGSATEQKKERTTWTCHPAELTDGNWISTTNDEIHLYCPFPEELVKESQ